MASRPEFALRRLLHRLVQRELGLGKYLGGNVGAQVASLRIDGLIFLFNSDGESGLHYLCFVIPSEVEESAVRQPHPVAGEVLTV